MESLVQKYRERSQSSFYARYDQRTAQYVTGLFEIIFTCLLYCVFENNFHFSVFAKS